MATRWTMHTTKHLEVDGLVVEFERKRVRNVNLRIRADGSVYVSAPFNKPEEEVVRFVRSKRSWIEEHLERVERRQLPAPTLYRDGEVTMLWGEPVSLRVVLAPTARAERVVQDGGELLIFVASRWMDDSDASVAHRRRLVERWGREQLEAAATPFFSRFEAKLGVCATQVRYRSMKSRWGSCNTKTGVITLNAQLLHYPSQCLESVVAHELCHLLEPSHNARFHAFLDSAYPSWREARAILNRGL